MKHILPETIWEYSLETEARRIINVAKSVSSNFFRINNFHVLPLGHPLNNSLTVTLPDLEYSRIPKFWREIERLSEPKMSFDIDERFLEKAIQLVKTANLRKPNFVNTERVWKKANKEIYAKIYELIPSKKDLIKKLIAHPTVVGTSSSFGWSEIEKKTLHVYLRDDQDIYALTEIILTALTRPDVYEKLDGVWQESEILVDWLVTESAISTTLKKYQPETSFIPTVKLTRYKQNAKVLKESDKFYKKLGLKYQKTDFVADNGKVLINGKVIRNLNEREKTLLKYFILNIGKVVDFDEVGNLIFKNEDDFSLWAIAKAVQRLREKLEENGFSGSYIQTLRGQGYLLKN